MGAAPLTRSCTRSERPLSPAVRLNMLASPRPHTVCARLKGHRHGMPCHLEAFVRRSQLVGRQAAVDLIRKAPSERTHSLDLCVAAYRAPLHEREMFPAAAIE